MILHLKFINKTKNIKNKKQNYKKTFFKRINQDQDKYIKFKKTE